MVVSPLYAGVWDVNDRIEHTGVTVDVAGGAPRPSLTQAALSPRELGCDEDDRNNCSERRLRLSHR